jgi:hypothetical protein
MRGKAESAKARSGEWNKSRMKKEEVRKGKWKRGESRNELETSRTEITNHLHLQRHVHMQIHIHPGNEMVSLHDGHDRT